MKRPAKKYRPQYPAYCACCGVPYLNDAETAVLIALFASPDELQTAQIAAVTGESKRIVRSALTENSALFVCETRNVEKMPRWFYSLSNEGLSVARRLTGSGRLEAAQ